jgi:hypothetical protein
MQNDTAIIVTSYCGGNFEAEKRKMTRVICKRLFEAGHHVVLASHSTIDEETQKYVHAYVYDSNNSFQINGLPNRTTNHGVAELTSVHNALKFLGDFKYFMKVTYDNKPDLDYHDVIAKCKQTGKKAVTAKWGNNVTYGTQMYFTEIDFFNRTLSLNEVSRCDKDLEYVWFDSIGDLGLHDDVCLLENYHNFMGQDVLQYSHSAGTSVDRYDFE